jgi:hypothetical protein
VFCKNDLSVLTCCENRVTCEATLAGLLDQLVPSEVLLGPLVPQEDRPAAQLRQDVQGVPLAVLLNIRLVHATLVQAPCTEAKFKLQYVHISVSARLTVNNVQMFIITYFSRPLSNFYLY